MAKTIIAKEIAVGGIVQGIGFRPFIYQLAERFGLTGEVSNTSAGVHILLEGSPQGMDGFLRDLQARPPALAVLTKVEARETAPRGFTRFSIVKSEAGPARATLISPDVSVCEDCLKELFDPADRRYLYPFINCTNCGPRYTIINDIPYDRPKTSMAGFTMCPDCQAEYDDPADRRFHAQPNACPVCGPKVELLDNQGRPVLCENPLAKAGELLKQGRVLAIKGLGGFHLAADARNSRAVSLLRGRKLREEKPLAVMVPDLDAARELAEAGPEEEALLSGFRRPIVLLKKRAPEALAPEVAPSNRNLGVMLPYTPMHYALMRHSPNALVMTSGNLSEEPICIDNRDALDRLGNIADFFLVHNRDIYLRSDDSIVRRGAGKTRFIRRSRGYVPTPVFLKNKTPQILACGALLKNTVCLTRGDQAFVSQHVGDLENLETLEFFRLTIDHLKRILDIEPQAVAHDMHPDYLSTVFAKELDLPRVEVQHHHAHIASCMAENQVEGQVIGVALDGTGLGTDRAVWGGEVLLCGMQDFHRAAHLSYTPMPGGNKAVKEPWRMAVSHLKGAFGKAFLDIRLPLLDTVSCTGIQTIDQMIDRNINAPLTSSTGRLFDAVAAITGLRFKASYDGQAAMELEMAADPRADKPYEWAVSAQDPMEILTAPIIRGAALDVEKGRPAAEIAGRFHASLIQAFAHVCQVLRTQTGVHQVALSGGSFQNSLLLSGLIRELESRGFIVFTHKICPANDGGLSLGQAMVAAASIT
ncbi:hydrogenase maturation protein HypF [Desulfatibacillum alkenivorans DSM 16219]|jgi:hydrogenase maturation protein HypF|uniref:Carbamoyltransferase n=1 Tax=Desulfatibacillum alkenivorans DSM 16219 TaxID=1121393 RepID=A0A1M6ICX9_9BACT|nr:carbamoyltransferase HypF [Desulfatibacillum alkenivorans]SHJ32322.1 hydrogenase maturation protein HypF [Desulfatibacillum alkenivorans DSM 16219]